jgi:DNA-binding MarR family transcriptional regulator
MDQPTPSVWNDTPSVQERIVSAISRIASVMRGGMWQFATQEGLNPAQADMLQLLLSRREGVRLSWLAQQLAISPASASDSVSALVSKGLVQKARAADDGRAVALLLTQAGVELAQRASQSLSFAGNAVSELPPATQEALLTGLLQLIGQLQRNERFPEIRACITCRHFQPNRHADHILFSDEAFNEALGKFFSQSNRECANFCVSVKTNNSVTRLSCLQKSVSVSLSS